MLFKNEPVNFRNTDLRLWLRKMALQKPKCCKYLTVGGVGGEAQ